MRQFLLCNKTVPLKCANFKQCALRESFGAIKNTQIFELTYVTSYAVITHENEQTESIFKNLHESECLFVALVQLILERELNFLHKNVSM